MGDRRGLLSAVRVEDALRTLLVEAPAPGSRLSTVEFDAVWNLATASRVHLVLGHRLLQHEQLIPEERRQTVTQRLREAQARDLLRCRALRQIVAAFDAASVPVLLLKGAGLAYTAYASPHLRPASDIDLFIASEALTAAENVLIACGYTRRLEPDAELASGQRHFERDDGFGKELVDLHWRVSNVRLFERVLSFDEAWRSSVAVPRLGSSARTLGRPDAIVLACVHRIAHHYDDPDLLWLWDIHLLCAALTDADADAILTRAMSNGVCSVVAHSLSLTREQFGTIIPANLVERLDSAGRHERAAEFVSGRLRQIDILRSDLATGSMLSNLQLLREHLFPSPVYMRRTYAGWPAVLMPVAYLHRICRGVPKWFTRL
jgi:hypothetical protein